MTTAAISHQGTFLTTLLHALTRLLRVLARHPGQNREPRASRRRRAGNHLDSLSDRLRQDIGLSDSSPSPDELLERFYRLHAAYPREHPIRLKPWLL